MPAARSALLATLFALALARPASAHPQARSYCSVHSVPGGIDVELEVPGHLLAPLLGLASPRPSAADLAAVAPQLAQVLRDRVTASTPAGACGVTTGPLEVVERDGDNAAEMSMAFTCPPGEVTLKNRFRLDVDPGSETVCAIDGSAWVFRMGMESRPVGTPPRLGEVLASFLRSGSWHVLSGLDHVLFVLGLLIAAALGARERSVWSATRSVAGVVTGFTLGHSLTLIGAGLGVVAVDARITESLIALSIAVVGVENAFSKQIRWRAVTAGVFGLVHGFGFASVLAESALPRRGAVLALLAFNLGVELAQLALVVVVFPGLALAARRRWYQRRLLLPLSLAIALLGLIWFVKRAAGLAFWPWLGG